MLSLVRMLSPEPDPVVRAWRHVLAHIDVDDWDAVVATALSLDQPLSRNSRQIEAAIVEIKLSRAEGERCQTT